MSMSGLIYVVVAAVLTAASNLMLRAGVHRAGGFGQVQHVEARPDCSGGVSNQNFLEYIAQHGHMESGGKHCSAGIAQLSLVLDHGVCFVEDMGISHLAQGNGRLTLHSGENMLPSPGGRDYRVHPIHDLPRLEAPLEASAHFRRKPRVCGRNDARLVISLLAVQAVRDVSDDLVCLVRHRHEHIIPVTAYHVLQQRVVQPLEYPARPRKTVRMIRV